MRNLISEATVTGSVSSTALRARSIFSESSFLFASFFLSLRKELVALLTFWWVTLSPYLTDGISARGLLQDPNPRRCMLKIVSGWSGLGQVGGVLHIRYATLPTKADV